MIGKLEPKNTMIGLLALYFALGFLVGKMSGLPSPLEAATPATAEATAEPGASYASAPTTVAQAPAVANASATAPAPTAAVAPTPTPTVAPTPVAAPTPAPKPVASPRAPTAKPAAPKKEDQVWLVTVRDEDMSMGPKKALLTVVFFSSFGCNTCKVFADAPKKLVEKYGDKIRIVWKHKVVPEQSIGESLDASVAALAAGAQGKFWEYHDRLFETGLIGVLQLEEHAKALGLNVDKWRKDARGTKYRQQALEDSLLANSVGAHSMPNIMVNGVRMRGPKTYDNLLALVESELPKAEAKVKGGMKLDALYATTIAPGKSFEQMAPSIGFEPSLEGASLLGKPEAKIKLVSFEDFQCPFCAKIGPSLKAFQARYPDDVVLVFKHMPLTSIHPEAMQASEASLAARAQGKFWEYHDVLMNNQKALTRPDLERYAENLGLDMAAFRADLDSGKWKPRIQRDMQEAQRAGVRGTPSVYVNGRKYQGPRGYPPEGLEAVASAFFGL